MREQTAADHLRRARTAIDEAKSQVYAAQRKGIDDAALEVASKLLSQIDMQLHTPTQNAIRNEPREAT